MLHPSQYFTEQQVQDGQRKILSFLADRELRKAATENQQTLPLKPIIYATADEARDARFNFEAQPDHEQQLASVLDDLNELYQLEEELLDIVKVKISRMTLNDAAHARRKILGYEETRKPSLPGILDEKYHVPGTLDRTRDKIAAIEAMLPRLRTKAAQYAHIKKSLAPWPWFRINRERTAEVEMNLVMNGERVQRRGL